MSLFWTLLACAPEPTAGLPEAGLFDPFVHSSAPEEEDTAASTPSPDLSHDVRLIRAVEGCGDGRTVVILTDGLISLAELYLYEPTQAGARMEYAHPFPPTEPWSGPTDDLSWVAETNGYHAADGAWANPRLELAAVADRDVVLGESTAASCGPGDMVTYAILVYDEAGEPADCLAGGRDPGDEETGFDFDACNASYR
ncbi:MAG: hypothetical protein H6739_23210 [Alphaproteobacteria bacterium]|nr:hypothetical protein [Alphaproteobacteria bacterium]